MEGPRPTSSEACTPASSDRPWRVESRRLPEQQEQMARRGKMDEPNLLERLGKGRVSAAGQSDTAHRIGWACRICRILQRHGFLQGSGALVPSFTTWSASGNFCCCVHGTFISSKNKDYQYREMMMRRSWSEVVNEDLGSTPRIHTKTPSMRIYDPRAGETESGRSLLLAGQPIQPGW